MQDVPFSLSAQLRDLRSRETRPAAPPAPAPAWYLDALKIVCVRFN